MGFELLCRPLLGAWCRCRKHWRICKRLLDRSLELAAFRQEHLMTLLEFGGQRPTKGRTACLTQMFDGRSWLA